MTRMRWRNVASHGLVALGLIQAVGFMVGSDTVRGLGVITAASPLPFVFSSFRDVETFAAEFTVTLVRDDGTEARRVITPELYAKLDGPYNRRNTYGAVMAYAPALTAPNERQLVDSVLGYGLCGHGPLAARFGERQPIRRVQVEVRSKTRGGPAPHRWEIPCSD